MRRDGPENSPENASTSQVIGVQRQRGRFDRDQSGGASTLIFVAAGYAHGDQLGGEHGYHGGHLSSTGST